MKRFPSAHAMHIALALGSLRCSQADLYPITPPASAQGGGGSSGNGSGGTADARGGAGAGGARGGAPNGGSPACPSAILPSGDSNQAVVVDGDMRSYVLHVPPAYSGRQAVPLVVDFHALGQSGSRERMNSPYVAELDAAGVVMAFPDGARGPAGTAWNVGPCCVAKVDDVAFARALVDQVRGVACIDPNRVYAIGSLTGGGMAHYLACHAADVFAAVAPASFDLLEENVDDCKPSRQVTVISFRGTADSRVPYDGGPSSLVPGMPITFLGAQGTHEKWASINGCVGPPSAPDANGCSGYSGCKGGAEVILCSTPNGADEPGDPAITWPVLQRHTL